MYDLRHLEHAIAVADHGGFRRAAEALGLSQPTLTRSLQHLESCLGATLFDRSRRGVEPTVFGRVVLERGRALIRDRRSLDREVELLKGLDVGALDVGVGPYAAALAAHAATARLVARRPGIHCRVRVMDWESLTRAVADGRCDLGLAEVSLAESRPDLAVELVMTRRGYFICRPDHEILRRPSVGVDDLLEFPWACSTMPDRAADQLPADLRRAGRREGPSFLPAICLDVVNDIAVMAEGSDVLCAVALPMVERELEAHRVAVVPFRPPWLHLKSGFITRRDRTPSPAAAAFMTLIKEIDEELEVRESALVARFLGRDGATRTSPRARVARS